MYVMFTDVRANVVIIITWLPRACYETLKPCRIVGTKIPVKYSDGLYTDPRSRLVWGFRVEGLGYLFKHLCTIINK